jgi:hypothetical protein
LGARVGKLNPTWNQPYTDETLMAGFLKAVELAGTAALIWFNFYLLSCCFFFVFNLLLFLFSAPHLLRLLLLATQCRTPFEHTLGSSMFPLQNTPGWAVCLAYVQPKARL